jgi:hypothetical protein
LDIKHPPWPIAGINHHVDQNLVMLKKEIPTDYEEMERQFQRPTEAIAGKRVQTRLNPRIREYKLPNDYRILFIIKFEQRQIIVGYAGRHLNKHRMDQQIRKLAKKC